MPLDSCHPDYEKWKADWRKLRDVVGGQRLVHAAGEKYLPRLKEQDAEDYDAYVKRALFFGGTQRTSESFVGMVFRKAPTIENPAGLKPLIEDITLENVPLNSFAQMVFTELVDVGRVGILVDYPRVDLQPASVAAAERAGMRPFVTFYKAECMLNWRTERIGNIKQLTLVTLSEEHIERVDEYSDEKITKLRVLILRDGVYQVEVYRPNKIRAGAAAANDAPPLGRASDPVTGNWIRESQSTPMMNGAPLNYIPFVIVGTTDLKADVEKPPLLDLADCNLSHYRTTADYEHGAHFVGLPTPVVSGYTPEKTGEKLYIGSSTAWVFPRPESRAYYLEFSGTGLGALSTLRNEKQDMMAALGARMLTADPKATETATTAMIHRTGEVSTLGTMANTLSRALTKMMIWLRDWSSISGDVKVQLSTDYFPIPLDPTMLTALVAAWQQGAISKETLFNNLQRGEIIAEGVTFDEEDAAIGDAPPNLQNQLTTIDATAAAKPPPAKPNGAAPTGRPNG